MESYTLAMICWVIAWIFNAANNLILFRFDESVFAHIRNEKIRAWFRGDLKEDLRRRGWPAPAWDGWHATKWLQWLFVYIGFGIGDFAIALAFSFAGMITFLLFYNMILLRPT
jgi:hypothetical protein